MNRIAFYDTRSYDKEAFVKENEKYGFEIEFFDFKLTEKTALTSKGFDAVCVFVNDTLNSRVISILNECGVKVILLRCAGFNNVDLQAAQNADIKFFVFLHILLMLLQNTLQPFCFRLQDIFHRLIFVQKL